MITRTIPMIAGILAIILVNFSGQSGAADFFSQAPQTNRQSEPLLPERMQTLYVIPEPAAAHAPAQGVRQTSFHQPAAAPAPRVAPMPTAPARQPQSAPASSLTARQFSPQALAAGNPFDYQRSASDAGDEGDSGFYPTKLVSLPPEIQLVGILMLKDREPIAAIRFPGTGKQLGEVHYVREGDDIEIPSSLLRPAGRQPKAAAQAAELDEIVYLKVRKITPQHVEVSSQSNMADRHFLR